VAPQFLLSRAKHLHRSEKTMKFSGPLTASRCAAVQKKIAPAVLIGIAFLFSGQGVRSQENPWARAITSCGTVISRPGAYYLAKDLTQCETFGVSIAVSSVRIELRGHTIQLTGDTNDAAINAAGGDAALSGLEIVGPGTLTGGFEGINLQNVHHSKVHGLMIVRNSFGMAVNSGDFTSDTTATATVSANNEIFDNVITGNNGHGITVNGGNDNLFYRNNVSGNSNNGVGLLLYTANNNVVTENTADVNDGWGIYIAPQSTGNKVMHNAAFGNGNSDLNDQSGACTQNTWADNSFASDTPGCIH
jgi:parallel beta-helix repeat protein